MGKSLHSKSRIPKIVKHEVAELNKSMEFINRSYEEKNKKLDEIVSNNETNSEVVEEKMADLEDRSRRNNLRFDGIFEENDESWERSEVIIRDVISNKLDIDEKNVRIERAHRSGKMQLKDGLKNNKRTIVVKFLSYKDKDKQHILQKFRERKLWNENLYINEDFSIYTMLKRKELFWQAREMRDRGINAKIVYNRIVVNKSNLNAENTGNH